MPIVFFLAALLPGVARAAITPQSFTVLVSAETQTSPPQIQLVWPSDSSAAQYDIYRKDPKGNSWGDPIATLPGSATGFTDSNVLVISAYEYQIVKTASDPPWPSGDPSQWMRGYGYICVGLMAPVVEQRGKVLLIIDSSFVRGLGNEITRLQQDLAGDGWTVITRPVSRQSSAVDVKNVILNEYTGDPANLQAVFLLGHVPVPYSGDMNPDFHADHKGAWPADVFYGDVDGNWTDNSVSDNSSGYAWNHNVPGDGKFDQSEIPSAVELEVGRVDLADMPSFSPLTELDLLRRYLDKDHNYRHAVYGAPRRGLIRDTFGVISGDAPATTAWRTFAPFFGAASITEADYNNYFPTLANQAYLWSYAGGGGSFTHADGVGSTQDFVASDPKTIFLMLHGSYFGDWNTTDNFLRAPLGTSYGLASAWTGLPHWFLHHMGIGETIGFSTRLTQNNHANGLYKNRLNSFAGDVHIALMGDPTLRMHVVAPPGNLRAAAGAGVVLNWDSAPDLVLGYYVYRSASPSGPFVRLDRGYIRGTSFTDVAAPPGTNTYMIRALKLESSASGTYFNLSQGIFASIDTPPPAEEPKISSFQIDSHGEVAIGIAASAGEAYRVEASTNLSQWITVASGVADSNGVVQFQEPEPKNVSSRFYRVRAM